MKTIAILILMLACCYPGITQEISLTEFDNLENVLSHVNKNDTRRIVQLGEHLIANTQSDEKKIYLLGIIISSYASNNDKSKSIEYLFRAKNIAERKGDHAITAKVYLSIASLYASLNLNDKAKIYLGQAWEETSKLPAGRNKNSLKAFVHNETGNFYLNTENIKVANQHYRQSLSEFNTVLPGDYNSSTPFYYKSLLLNYGKSFVQLGKVDSAEVQLTKASAVSDTLYPYLKFNIYISLSDVYIERKQFKRAADTLQVILKDAAFDFVQLKSIAYLNLARSYKGLGDLKNYSVYNEKYLTLSNAAKGEDMTAINNVFSAEQYELKTKSDENKTLYAIILCSTIALGVAWFIIIRRKNQRENQAYRTVIAILTNKQIIESATPDKSEVVTASSVSIPEQVAQDILRKLNDFEKYAGFTNQNVSISTLAVQFKTNATYLSEVINREKGKNFNSYINELRITFICNQIINNPEFSNYKISYLAQECGFNSHSAFATVFKNVVGIAPSAFIKQTASGRN